MMKSSSKEAHKDKFKPNLSVAIITFNEERIIEKTLSAISNWVDEIVIVDSFSTDKTIDIIQMFDVNLYQEKWRGYADQKNLAISKCSGNWILVLDADEVVTKELKDEILTLLKNPGDNVGFKVKRKFFIGSYWVKNGGYYPDFQLRLFDGNVGAQFSPRAVHESIHIEGNVDYLENPLEHYAYENIDDYKTSLKKYAELASVEIKNKKLYLPFFRAMWAFLFRYFFRLGFLDGELGYNLSKAYSVYVYEKYNLAKQKNKKLI